MIKINRIGAPLAILISLLASGCAATRTAIEHRNLKTETKMSKTIFLDPVDQQSRTIFVSIKNTSDQELSIENVLKNIIRSHGYKVVINPMESHYMLQANVLQVGLVNKDKFNQNLLGGFGSQLHTTLGAVATAAYLSSSSDDVFAAGLLGASGSFVADALVKDVTYGMLTDIQITERTRNKENKYSTRIASTANKVNLTFSEARPALEKGLVKAISGIF